MTIPRAVVTAFPPLALASRTGSSCTSVSRHIRPVRKDRPYGDRSRVRKRPIIHVQGASRYPLIWGGGGSSNFRLRIYELTNWAGRARKRRDSNPSIVIRQSSISPYVYDSAAQRLRQGGGAIVHVEFLEDALDVRAGRVAADAQGGGNLLVALARGEQFQYL